MRSMVEGAGRRCNLDRFEADPLANMHERRAAAAAPSTTLRAVPLPRLAGEDARGHGSSETGHAL